MVPHKECHIYGSKSALGKGLVWAFFSALVRACPIKSKSVRLGWCVSQIFPGFLEIFPQILELPERVVFGAMSAIAPSDYHTIP